MTDLVNTLGSLDGARIPGGCDHCNAYQTVRPVTAGMWTLTVHHDDWCPDYINMHRSMPTVHRSMPTVPTVPTGGTPAAE